MHKGLLLPLFLLFSVLGYSQTINGTITDEQNNSLLSVNISILNQSMGAISDENGKYSLEIPPNRSVVVVYSFIGYEMEKIRIPMLKEGQNYTLNIQLKTSSTLLEDVIITDQKSRKESFSRIKPKHVSVLPGIVVVLKPYLKLYRGLARPMSSVPNTQLEEGILMRT